MSGGRVAEVVARLSAQRDLLQAVRREVDTVVMRVSSADGSIEAEVNGRGELTGLRLTERACAHGPAGVAAGIVAAAGAAARLVTARQFDLAAALSARLDDPLDSAVAEPVAASSQESPVERIWS